MPTHLFAESALLLLPEGQPLAVVREIYMRGVLDFGPAATPDPPRH
jgi:hypothetical protein